MKLSYALYDYLDKIHKAASPAQANLLTKEFYKKIDDHIKGNHNSQELNAIMRYYIPFRNTSGSSLINNSDNKKFEEYSSSIISGTDNIYIHKMLSEIFDIKDDEHHKNLISKMIDVPILDFTINQ